MRAVLAPTPSSLICRLPTRDPGAPASGTEDRRGGRHTVPCAPSLSRPPQSPRPEPRSGFSAEGSPPPCLPQGPSSPWTTRCSGECRVGNSATAGDQSGVRGEREEAETSALLPSWPGLPLGRDTAAAAGTRGNAQAPGSWDGRGEERRTGKGKGRGTAAGRRDLRAPARGRNEVGQENKR